MKIKLLILLITIGIESCHCQGNGFYIFLGYNNDKPIFIDLTSNNLYEIDSLLQVKIYMKSEKNSKPLFINNRFLILETSENGRKNLCIKDIVNQNIKEIPLSISPNYVTANEDCSIIILQEDYSSIEIIDTKTNKSNKSLLGGFDPKIVGEELFYLTKSARGSGFVDIVKTKLSDFQYKEFILKGVFEEGLFISPDKEYIACEISLNGKPVKSIFNVKNSSFHVLKEESTLLDNDFTPIFLLKPKSILYYSISEFKKIKIDLPFDYNLPNSVYQH